MIPEINILRIFFILFIFLEHSAFFSGGGYLGVALFFLLGGFCMTLGYHDKVTGDGFNYRKYLVGRFSKFYPLHWICLIAWIALAIISDMPVGRVPSLIANIFLVQSWIPDESFYFGFNGISWYLADTVFFTVVFPVLMKKIVSGSTARNSLFLGILAIGYILACVFVPKEMRHAILYINPIVRLVDFVVGIYTAKLFLSIKEKESFRNVPLWVYYAVCIICMAALIAETGFFKDKLQFACIFWPIGILLILSSSMAGTVRGSRKISAINTLSNIGQYTFAFYMIHQMTIQVCNSVAHKTGFEYHFWVMVITLFLTFAASVICHRFIEKPCSDHIRKRLA